MMHPAIIQYCKSLATDFQSISAAKRKILEEMASFIRAKEQAGEPIQLVYICTHNSRRSHFGQVWATVAANYYKVKNVHSYSGGTEATEFNVNAINALERIGFEIYVLQEKKNPVYQVKFDDTSEPIECFSKKYSHSQNPQKDFAAIMTCSEADVNCPYIPGAKIRFATPYEDPKAFDGLPSQDSEYDKRCRQIALETFYLFSLIHKK